MATSYATRGLITGSTVTDTVATGIWKPLELMMDQATAAAIQHPQRRATDLSITASEKSLDNQQLLWCPHYCGPPRPIVVLSQGITSLKTEYLEKTHTAAKFAIACESLSSKGNGTKDVDHKHVVKS